MANGWTSSSLQFCRPDDLYPVYKIANQIMSIYWPSGLQIFLKCKPDGVTSGLQIIN